MKKNATWRWREHTCKHYTYWFHFGIAISKGQVTSDGQKVMHMSPLCICTGMLKNLSYQSISTPHLSGIYFSCGPLSIIYTCLSVFGWIKNHCKLLLCQLKIYESFAGGMTLSTMPNFLLAVFPVSCYMGCECYHDFTEQANIMNCSDEPLVTVPPYLPKQTDFFLLNNGQLQNLCANDTLLKGIKKIELSNNEIRDICDEVFESLMAVTRKSAEVNIEIDLRNNKIETLPEKIQSISSVYWYLSGNPYHCSCDNLWMAQWLTKNRTIIGSSEFVSPVVRDYSKVLCSNGEFPGTPIYTLDSEILGCIPSTISKVPVILVASTGGGVLFLICILAIIISSWTLIRWIIFKNFNTYISRRSNGENLEDAVFDALVSYR